MSDFFVGGDQLGEQEVGQRNKLFNRLLEESVVMFGEPYTSLTCAHLTATTIVCKFLDIFLRGTSAPEQVDAVKNIKKESVVMFGEPVVKRFTEGRKV